MKLSQTEMEEMDKEYDNSREIKANKVAFLEYFGYFCDRKRADLLNRIETRQKIRSLP